MSFHKRQLSSYSEVEIQARRNEQARIRMQRSRDKKKQSSSSASSSISQEEKTKKKRENARLRKQKQRAKESESSETLFSELSNDNDFEYTQDLVWIPPQSFENLTTTSLYFPPQLIRSLQDTENNQYIFEDYNHLPPPQSSSTSNLQQSLQSQVTLHSFFQTQRRVYARPMIENPQLIIEDENLPTGFLSGEGFIEIISDNDNNNDDEDNSNNNNEEEPIE